MFFIVYLRDCGMTLADLPATQDPDPQFGGELADGRVPLLMFCRERQLEFSTLRRATFTSMVICSELHVEQANSVSRLIRSCVRCHAKTMTAFVCTTCEVLTLSVTHSPPSTTRVSNLLRSNCPFSWVPTVQFPHSCKCHQIFFRFFCFNLVSCPVRVTGAGE